MVSDSGKGPWGAGLASRGRRVGDRRRNRDASGKTEPCPTGSELLWEPQRQPWRPSLREPWGKSSDQKPRAPQTRKKKTWARD